MIAIAKFKEVLLVTLIVGRKRLFDDGWLRNYFDRAFRSIEEFQRANHRAVSLEFRSSLEFREDRTWHVWHLPEILLQLSCLYLCEFEECFLFYIYTLTCLLRSFFPIEKNRFSYWNIYLEKRICLIEIKTNIFKTSRYYYKHLFHYSTQLFDYNLFHNKYKYLKIEKYRVTLIGRTF